MTYIITPTNEGVPIAIQPGTTGRVVKEDDTQINIADWIQAVSTPGSSVNLNIDASSMTIVVEQDEGNVLANMQNGEVLFQSDFQAGVDTLNKVHIVYNEVLKLPAKVNASATGGTGSVFETDFTEGSVSTFIDYTGQIDKNQWVMQSQTSMKFNNSATGYAVFNAKLVDNTPYFGNVRGVLVSRKGGVDTAVEQISWNINNFLTAAPDPTNPAGIEYFSNRINSYVFQVPNRDSGDVKFGFIIDNKVIFAHAFTKQNSAQDNIALVNKPLRIEGSRITTLDGVLRFGFFNHDSGYFFEFRSETLVGAGLNSRFYSMAAYSSGALGDNFYRTFSAGNEAVTLPVTTRRPLVSIFPKLTFPPAIGSVNNEVIISLKEINISGESLNLNDGIFVEVIVYVGPIASLLSAGMGSISFNPVDVDSSVDFNVLAEGISSSFGKRVYSSTVYANRGNVVLNVEKSLSNFMNQYASSNINALGFASPVNAAPIISVAATSISGNTIDVSANLVWTEKA